MAHHRSKQHKSTATCVSAHTTLNSRQSCKRNASKIKERQQSDPILFHWVRTARIHTHIYRSIGWRRGGGRVARQVAQKIAGHAGTTSARSLVICAAARGLILLHIHIYTHNYHCSSQTGVDGLKLRIDLQPRRGNFTLPRRVSPFVKRDPALSLSALLVFI